MHALVLFAAEKQEHARSNVKLARPAHDRWGIGKIVFVYSDDFLKKAYTFPWFHDPEWRQVMTTLYSSVYVYRYTISPVHLTPALNRG